MVIKETELRYIDGTWREIRVLSKQEHLEAFPSFPWVQAGLVGSIAVLLAIFAAMCSRTLSEKPTSVLILAPMMVCLAAAGMSAVAYDKQNPATPREVIIDPSEIPEDVRASIESRAVSASVVLHNLPTNLGRDGQLML
jgi:hypothetical protein